MAKAMTLEESFEKLEDIIGKMEEGNTSLDDTFKLYNEGIKLVKNCNSMLDKVEKQIVIVSNEEDSRDGL